VRRCKQPLPVGGQNWQGGMWWAQLVVVLMLSANQNTTLPPPHTKLPKLDFFCRECTLSKTEIENMKSAGRREVDGIHCLVADFLLALL